MTPFTRRQQAVPFVANTKQIVPLNKSLGYREIALKLTGTLTCTAGNNTQANTLRGDEHAVLQTIAVVANSSEVLCSFSGDDLFWINTLLYGVQPKISVQLGSGVANPVFDSLLIVPFWSPRAAKPMDTFFEASVGLSDLRLEVTWGSHLSINASATGFTAGPTLEVMTHENDLSPYFSPAFISRKITQIQQFAGAQNAARINLDVGLPRYFGFLINATTLAGVDTPGLITNLKLKTGSTEFLDVSETTLLQWQKERNAVPFWIDKTPNVAKTAFADAFGVAAQPIVDVGAAFNQVNINNNIRALSDQLDAVTNLLNGQAYQMQPRISTQSDYRAWYPVLLCTDGYLQEAPDSLGLNELYLELALSAAANVRVINLQLIPNPRRRAVLKYPTAA